MKLFSSQKAQFSIEYTALAVLAMLALLVMGSYVTRSINAYFKSSEDTVDESYAEILLQSEQSVKGSPRCVLDAAASKNEGVCGGGPCKPYEKHYRLVYYPSQPGIICDSRDECVYARQDCCEHNLGACEAMGCPYGTEPWADNCTGEPVVSHYCKENTECLFKCEPDIDEDRARWCAIDGVSNPARPPGLGADTLVTYVPDGECSGALCEAECFWPYYPADSDGDRLPDLCDFLRVCRNVELVQSAGDAQGCNVCRKGRIPGGNAVFEICLTEEQLAKSSRFTFVVSLSVRKQAVCGPFEYRFTPEQFRNTPEGANLVIQYYSLTDNYCAPVYYPANWAAENGVFLQDFPDVCPLYCFHHIRFYSIPLPG